MTCKRSFYSTCIGCSRVYSKESSSGDMCHDCSSEWKAQETAKPNIICELCMKRFYSPNLITKCPSCAQKPYADLDKKEKKYDNSKPTKKRKGVSYEELNRRAEYKRVMDDHGWDHYLKGRKWDRI
jgi:rRNA maturation endonuclease Nob1